MTIHYSATPEDVGALYSYALRHSWRFRLTLAAYAVIPGLIWLLGGGRSPGPIDVVVAGVVAAAMFVLIPLLAKWRTKTDVRTLSVSSDGLATTIGRVAGTIPWTKVHAIWDAGDHIFILRKNLNGLTIPRRAFADASQRAEFLAACQRYVGLPGASSAPGRAA